MFLGVKLRVLPHTDLQCPRFRCVSSCISMCANWGKTFQWGFISVLPTFSALQMTCSFVQILAPSDSLALPFSQIHGDFCS